MNAVTLTTDGREEGREGTFLCYQNPERDTKEGALDPSIIA